MKKIILILISFVVLTSCSSNDEIDATSTSSLKHIVTNNGETIYLKYTKEYIFDSEGKVIKEISIDSFNPENKSTSTFEYDNQGRVIKEVRNDELYHSVVWDGNFAHLHEHQSNINMHFTFLNDKLIEYNYENGNDYKLNYDLNDNVISEMQADTVFVEYLDYDTTVTNPMHLIKSIGILRMDSKPYFKNFYHTKKAYPFLDYDYYYPLSYYSYQSTVNSENKITQITNNDNYYISNFEYN